jgi:hypothetical protein
LMGGEPNETAERRFPCTRRRRTDNCYTMYNGDCCEDARSNDSTVQK